MAATSAETLNASMKKALKRAAYRARVKRRSIAGLMSAALAIPGLGIPAIVSAQSSPAPAEVRFQWATYRDYQNNGVDGRQDRIDVDSPMFWARTPIGDSTEIEVSGMIDSVSGASPHYLDTLSGASGTGIEDRRSAGDFKVTHYFERFSLGAGYAGSIEDDYRSHSGLLEAKTWTSDMNTTFAASYAFDSDQIACTNNELIDETRRTGRYLVGVTQVVSPVAIVQSNLTYDNADGYMSDPYKILDNRPRSRDSFAWLTRYNRFIESLNGSLHTDYRLAHDSFGITSHTMEVAFYKPIGEKWMVRPRVRYYSQHQANFFSTTFPPENVGESFYSTDGRLGSFGGVTVGMKVERDLGEGFSVNVTGDYLEQRPGWVLGGNGSAGVRRFYAPFFSVGIAKRF